VPMVGARAAFPPLGLLMFAIGSILCTHCIAGVGSTSSDSVGSTIFAGAYFVKLVNLAIKGLHHGIVMHGIVRDAATARDRRDTTPSAAHVRQTPVVHVWFDRSAVPISTPHS